MILTLLLVIAAGILVIVVFDWIIHISMVKDQTSRYGWAGHKKFIEQFNKVEWIHDYMWNSSLFAKEYNQDQYHAGIIKFNYNGMIINNPFSHIIVKLYVRRYINANYRERKIDGWR